VFALAEGPRIALSLRPLGVMVDGVAPLAAPVAFVVADVCAAAAAANASAIAPTSAWRVKFIMVEVSCLHWTTPDSRLAIEPEPVHPICVDEPVLSSGPAPWLKIATNFADGAHSNAAWRMKSS
jgi:hypothetical protein